MKDFSTPEFVPYEREDCVRCEGCRKFIPPGLGVGDEDGIELCARCGVDCATDYLQHEHRAQRIRDIIGVQWLEMCGVIWRFMTMAAVNGGLDDDGGASLFLVERINGGSFGRVTPLPLHERHRSAVDIVDGSA